MGAVDSQTCRLCGENATKCFDAQVLRRYHVGYFLCASCGYLQTESPYWLDEAYKTPIARSDTGVVQRNIANAWRLSGLLYFCGCAQGRNVDVAGGYGLLTRLMRDLGFDFYWNDEYCENLFARGFEATNAPASCEAVTAFEVLEHVQAPLQFLSSVIEKFGPQLIVVSTQIFYGNAPSPSWWYYAFETGQHIGFYQIRTLQYLARALGYHLVSSGSYHVMSKKKLPSRFLLRTCLGWPAPLVAGYVRARLRSRTFADHKKLLGKE